MSRIFRLGSGFAAPAPVPLRLVLAAAGFVAALAFAADVAADVAAAFDPASGFVATVFVSGDVSRVAAFANAASPALAPVLAQLAARTLSLADLRSDSTRLGAFPDKSPLSVAPERSCHGVGGKFGQITLGWAPQGPPPNRFRLAVRASVAEATRGVDLTSKSTPAPDTARHAGIWHLLDVGSGGRGQANAAAKSLPAAFIESACGVTYGAQEKASKWPGVPGYAEPEFAFTSAL